MMKSIATVEGELGYKVYTSKPHWSICCYQDIIVLGVVYTGGKLL